MDDKNRYLFAEPGMHNIASCFTRVERKPENLRALVVHGNRTIVVVEQGESIRCQRHITRRCAHTRPLPRQISKGARQRRWRWLFGRIRVHFYSHLSLLTSFGMQAT